MRPQVAIGAAVALLLSLSGCGGDVRRGEVETTAAAFHHAYEARDAATACSTLAPPAKSALQESAGKPCEEALLGEKLPAVGQPERVEVFGTEAQVRYAGDTTFLARYQGGWKVVATGCSYRAHQPYDCTISGG